MDQEAEGLRELTRLRSVKGVLPIETGRERRIGDATRQRQVDPTNGDYDLGNGSVYSPDMEGERPQRIFDAAEKAAKKFRESIKDIAGDITNVLGGALDHWVNGQWKAGFKSILTGFAEMLQQMMLKWVEAKIFKSLMKVLGGGSSSSDDDEDSGGNGSGGIGSIAGVITNFLGGLGKHANGGDFSNGKPILVGERGPEIIFPRTPGSVMSNEELRRGGGNGGSSAPPPLNVVVNLKPDRDGRIRSKSQIEVQVFGSGSSSARRYA